MLNRIEHGVMLRSTRNQMTATRSSTPAQSKDRQIIRFRSAACKNQFVRLHAQQMSQAIAAVIDRGASVPSGRVNARRIAEVFA
jgi:hypothetical protein